VAVDGVEGALVLQFGANVVDERPGSSNAASCVNNPDRVVAGRSLEREIEVRPFHRRSLRFKAQFAAVIQINDTSRR
jgi:hypothetical protein